MNEAGDETMIARKAPRTARPGCRHLLTRSALFFASLAIAGCANIPADTAQADFDAYCKGLPVTKVGTCDREQLDDHQPMWQRAQNADVFEALFTAYDRVGAQVLSGALTEQQGEDRMTNVKAALAEAAKKTGEARRQAIAQAVTSAGTSP